MFGQITTILPYTIKIDILLRYLISNNDAPRVISFGKFRAITFFPLHFIKTIYYQYTLTYLQISP